MKLHALFTFALSLIPCIGGQAQTARLGHGIHYAAEVSTTVSTGDYAPFWLSAGRQGLSSTKPNSIYARGSLWRPVETDSLRHWRIGYGADFVIPAGFTSPIVVQQLYADIQWKALRLSIGSKERTAELKNAALSSGGMTFSGNARPVPQVRVELPDFWSIPGTHEWLSIKGHLAYGRFTDSKFQENHVPNGGLRTKGVRYHSKAGFLRVGNARKFPLTFTGGLEMYAQFGGEAFNVLTRPDNPDFDNSHVKMSNNAKSYWHAFIPGGSDATDGQFKNSEGNQLGSWHFSLSYEGQNWGLRGYAEHYFEDHSQMFLQYGWKDMLWGSEVRLPQNPFVGTLLYEHLRTTDQSGAVYHDATDQLPLQISGIDNYYGHSIYGGWQHWGQGIGNPLLLSPIYNADHTISFLHNRIRAHHIGVSGQPLPSLSYRLLFSHVRSLGTYAQPTDCPLHANFFMAEANYAPPRLRGFAFTATFGTNGGSLIGNSVGGMITIRKTGLIR